VKKNHIIVFLTLIVVVLVVSTSYYYFEVKTIQANALENETKYQVEVSELEDKQASLLKDIERLEAAGGREYANCVVKQDYRFVKLIDEYDKAWQPKYTYIMVDIFQEWYPHALMTPVEIANSLVPGEYYQFELQGSYNIYADPGDVNYFSFEVIDATEIEAPGLMATYELCGQK